MTITIFQAHYDSLSDLVRSVGDRSSAVRAEAELDGVILAAEESVPLAEQHLTEPQSEESVAAARLAAFALQATSLYPIVLSRENSDFRTGARFGLRLSHIKANVTKLANASPTTHWARALGP